MNEKYLIYNKKKKYFVTPFVKLTLSRLEWCIESIFKEFGGNVDLVIVINPTLLENERKSFKPKEEIIKNSIATILQVINGIDKGINYEYAKFLRERLSEAYINLKTTLDDPTYNILYEVDGYKVVYDRMLELKKKG